ncbi:type I polyketide synthase [Paenibacillus lutrae]|uniref:SDR family NAD(P)-dependent oxidoreductase n=1 Tax=Paenibacillus lutrae TaxID=2078573 RepID=A0A7X3FK62_9BACL|nr:type I polyketide synthase [Paenibacillus lutrae]MVP01213.1 SDR family NAD(P)-dependent oxidoreductase [Paenibacillus lutrae]
MDFRSIKLGDMTLGDSNDFSEIAIEEISEQDIAIIGISLKLPLAETPEEFWHNLRTGLDCVRDIPSVRKQDADRYLEFVGLDPDQITYGEAAYLDEIDKFDYTFFKLSPKEASLLDPNQRLFLQTAWNAIEDAGYGGSKLEGSRTGVYLGYGSDSDYKKMIHEVEPESVSLSMPGNVRPIIASRLSYLMDLNGPSMVVDTTCSSSLVAVHLACQAIRNGECDLALAGGIQVHLIPVREFEVGIESSTSRARTFDDDSDGTGTGEGVVAMLLKPLSKAQEDRDHVYAVIKSSAVNQDGSSVGITAPNAKAQEAVIVEAWKRAGIDPRTISYIEAHGTGTKLGDPIEIEGIQRAFRRYTDDKQFCAVGSVKSNIGHLDNTAGIAGMLKAVLSLKHKELVPTLHFEKPNSKIAFEESPIYVNNRLEKWESEADPRRCGVSSFGLSGTNCHLVLEEAPAGNPAQFAGVAARPELFVLSAKTESALQSLIHSYITFLKNHPSLALGDLCYTVCTGRGHYPYRLAFAVEDVQELIRLLEESPHAGLQEQAEFLPGNRFVDADRVNDNVRRVSDANRQKEMNITAEAELFKFLDSGKQNAAVLRELCSLYIQGAAIEWDRLYRQEKRKRISLPTYPFDKHRCWLDLPELMSEDNEADADNLYHQTIWMKQPLQDLIPAHKPGRYLIFNDHNGISSGLVQKLRAAGSQVFEVGLGDGYEKRSDSSFVIGGKQADYERLLEDLSGKPIDRIVHLLSLSSPDGGNSRNDLEHRLNHSVYSMFFLVQALIQIRASEQVDIVIVTERADEVISEQDKVIPEHSALIGLGKVVRWESPNLKVRSIDVDPTEDVAETIWTELHCGTKEYKIAYRHGVRYVERIDTLHMETVESSPVVLKSDGVYLITGGLGGIGLHIARHLASQEKVHLAMINRTGLPPRSEWDGLLRGSNSNSKQSRALRAVLEIERMGSQVDIIQADTANEAQMRAALDLLRDKHGHIRGVIHAAGIGEGNLLGNLTEDEFRQIIASKIQGTWLLDRLTEQDQLEFFVMFASAITLMGGMGSGPYTAGNAYLEGFASYRAGLGKRTLTISWPAWNNTGLAEGEPVQEEKELFHVLPVKQGVKAFHRSLNHKITHIFAGLLNHQSDLYALGEMLPFRLAPSLQPDGKTAPKAAAAGKLKENIAIRLKGKADSRYTEAEQKVAQAWKQVLGYDELDVQANFFEIGGDSILITKVHALIEEQFPGRTTIADLFSYPTIAKMAEHLSDAALPEESALPSSENAFKQEMLRIFDHLGNQDLSIDEALDKYHCLEVANG